MAEPAIEPSRQLQNLNMRAKNVRHRLRDEMRTYDDLFEDMDYQLKAARELLVDRLHGESAEERLERLDSIKKELDALDRQWKINEKRHRADRIEERLILDEMWVTALIHHTELLESMTKSLEILASPSIEVRI